MHTALLNALLTTLLNDTFGCERCNQHFVCGSENFINASNFLSVSSYPIAGSGFNRDDSKKN